MKYLETLYVFDASAQTVQFTRWPSGTLKKEGILLISNVEDGVIIYNFADPAKGGTIASDAGGDILTLEHDTTSMSDTDALQIFYDDGSLPSSDDLLSDVDTDLQNILSVLPPSRGAQTGADSLSIVIASSHNVPVVNGGSSLSVDDGGGSLTVDGTVTINAIPAGTNNIGDVDIASIAAGDNNIGNVDVVTLPSIPAGNNNIGDVDVASLPALVAGTAIIGKVGIDQTTPGTTNGVQINAALPAGTNAIGKLAANSGVDIGDVDVTSLPSIPAGTNNIGDVDVLTLPADPLGANADATVAAGATGSISAKLRRVTQGLEDLKTLIVLGAGNNNIGDVDVASIAAGTNLIGKTVAQLSTSAISNGTTDVTPKFAKIDRATNADGAAVVSLVSAKKIRVLTLTMVSAGTVSVKWQSSTSNSTGAGSNTDLTGLMSLVANTGMADVFSPVGLFETVAGEALKLNLNAAVQVSGYLTYLEI